MIFIKLPAPSDHEPRWCQLCVIIFEPFNCRTNYYQPFLKAHRKFFLDFLSDSTSLPFREPLVPINSTSKINFHYNNPSQSRCNLHALFLFFINQSWSTIVWYFSCKRGPFSKVSKHLRADSRMLKSTALDKLCCHKMKSEWQVSRHGCEKGRADLVVFVLQKVALKSRML